MALQPLPKKWEMMKGRMESQSLFVGNALFMDRPIQNAASFSLESVPGRSKIELGFAYGTAR